MFKSIKNFFVITGEVIFSIVAVIFLAIFFIGCYLKEKFGGTPCTNIFG